MFKVAFIAAAMLLTGCAATQPKVVQMVFPFDDAAAAEAMKPGTNSVTGSAFLRQRGGGVVTCAGAGVMLFPATRYAVERVKYLYGNSRDGVRSVSQHRELIQFEPDAPGYKTAVIETRCDAQGKFSFDRVADGDWFVVTQVTWSTGPYNTEGGTLMQRFSLNGGEVKNLIIGR